MTDKQTKDLMVSVANKVFDEGRQILMVVDSFEGNEGAAKEVSIIGVKDKNFVPLLVHLIKSAASYGGTDFKTAMKLIAEEAEKRALNKKEE